MTEAEYAAYVVELRRQRNAEAQRRYRAKQGFQFVHVKLSAPAGAALIYLRNQWEFDSNRSVVEAALRHLAVETRDGLKRIRLTIDD
ncbi:MAG: hypothetical protein EBZ60_09480 [Betaproteobacteria bacterium]|nr:hypothetical protein [Betaproteobacteria bacterium]